MSAAPTSLNLRPRDGRAQPTTLVELFFDLVFVFAVTQISHLLIADHTLAGIGRAALLLLIVWWAWIYTTWMVNWFDPTAAPVRVVVLAVMLASLLMAAAVPEAFGREGLLFAGSYVALQVGRNVAALLLLSQEHVLRASFERIVFWSLLAGALWLAGGLLDGHTRVAVWLAALTVDVLAPVVGYRTPGRGRSATHEYDIDGGHFAERCQGFVLIALGESIVITGATAAGAGLTSTVVSALVIAFLGTGALWWLYFGDVAEHSRRHMAQSEDPGRLARDAYTYLHVPIVAGIILAASGNDLLIAHPSATAGAATVALIAGGPALFLLGETLFRVRMIGSASPKRVATVAVLATLALAAPPVSALVLSATVAAVLAALAVWEHTGSATRREHAPKVEA